MLTLNYRSIGLQASLIDLSNFKMLWHLNSKMFPQHAPRVEHLVLEDIENLTTDSDLVPDIGKAL